ncbi:MAG: LCP family protein [Clostridiales Family XIII bacterium]|jgi:LCP family protein required for cell wall assembly|nr:LCP family protein [Clostridiales Family XIII bacterium]
MNGNRSSKANRANQANNYFIKILSLIVSLGSIASFALVLLSLIEMKVAIYNIILVAVLVDAVLVFLPFYFIASGKSVRIFALRYGCIAISALMIFLNLFASSYMALTSDFLDDQFGIEKGNIEYSVVAQRTSNIELSKQIAVRAGIQSTDSCKTEAEEQTQQIADATFMEYDNLSELIDATASDTISIAVVQSVFLVAYAEYFPESYGKLDILATFKAGTASASGTQAVADIDTTKPFALYVSGVDDDGDIDQVARSDVNMLVLIDPKHYKILLVNTPRDYYVQLAGKPGLPDKLTHAGTYGIDVGEATLEDLYGINIDYHVLVNYTTLGNLVNSLGGIYVDNPQQFNLWGHDFPEGRVHLDGENAMLFCRERKHLEDGDNSRGENQQRVIEGIVAQMSASNVVTHYKDILAALDGTFRSNIPPSVITQLFNRQITFGGQWTIEKISVTGTNSQQPTYSMGSDRPLSVVLPDMDSVNAARAQMERFLRGEDDAPAAP